MACTGTSITNSICKTVRRFERQRLHFDACARAISECSMSIDLTTFEQCLDAFGIMVLSTGRVRAPGGQA